MDTPVVTAEHNQTESNKYVVHFPAHEPRATDPHYAAFNSMRAKLIKLGVGCKICGTRDKLELHHGVIEFTLANDVDVTKFTADFPDVNDEDKFLAWIEGEGNVEWLCMTHHRSPYEGIHHVDYPNWIVQKYLKQGIELLAPAKN